MSFTNYTGENQSLHSNTLYNNKFVLKPVIYKLYGRKSATTQ